MNEKVFEPYPEFETGRLFLRKLKGSDTALVFEFNSNLESLQFIPRDPWTDIKQATEKMDFFIEAYKKKEAIWWSFTLKETGKVIGYGGVFNIDKDNNKAEIGYGLLPGNSGKGLMTEALSKIVNFTVDQLKLHRIYALVVPGNTGSEKVLEKFGFNKEGVLRHHKYSRKKYFDMGMFSLINDKSDW